MTWLENDNFLNIRWSQSYNNVWRMIKDVILYSILYLIDNGIKDKSSYYLSYPMFILSFIISYIQPNMEYDKWFDILFNFFFNISCS